MCRRCAERCSFHDLLSRSPPQPFFEVPACPLRARRDLAVALTESVEVLMQDSEVEYADAPAPMPKAMSFGAVLRAALRGEQHDYTRGSLDRAIVMLAIPMVLEMIMES